jgi:hypothetical protein
MESKELPDDVLRIISDYSRPAFVHFREYNQALKLFSLPLDYKERLKKKIDDPEVRHQIKICVKAEAEYHENNANYLAKKTHENEYIKDKSHWWASVSKDKFVALINEKEYHMQGYAEWYFQDDIDDAWRNSDDSPSEPEWDAEGYEIQSPTVEGDSESD